MYKWKEIIEFLEILGKLKNLPRSGWVHKVGVSNPESVAEHIFRTALFAMIYGDINGLDSEKLMRMALLHDIAEAYTGDLMPEEKKKLAGEKEYKIIEKILSYLPKRLYKKYMEIYKEFENGNSKEAEAVREIDKLEMVLQALEYERKGYSKENLSEFWETVFSSLKNEETKSIYKIMDKMRSS